MARSRKQDDFVLGILILCTGVVAVWGLYTLLTP